MPLPAAIRSAAHNDWLVPARHRPSTQAAKRLALRCDLIAAPRVPPIPALHHLRTRKVGPPDRLTGLYDPPKVRSDARSRATSGGRVVVATSPPIVWPSRLVDTGPPPAPPACRRRRRCDR